MEQKKLYYAAWWRRFLAFWIDILVFLPVIIFQTKAMKTSPRLYTAIMVPYSIIFTGETGRGSINFSHKVWRQKT